MKSIKEKAEEYTNGFHQSIRRMCKESFVDGANYVLEQIENCRKEFYNINDSLIISEIIKELKK